MSSSPRLPPLLCVLDLDPSASFLPACPNTDLGKRLECSEAVLEARGNVLELEMVVGEGHLGKGEEEMRPSAADTQVRDQRSSLKDS